VIHDPADDHVDYGLPRRVWEPTASAPDSPWWGKIPKMIMEANDLSPVARNIYALCVTRQSGYRDYPVHGKQFVADLLGVSAATVKTHTEELHRRGILRVTKNPTRGKGEAAIEYHVLWAPQWRDKGDPSPATWNPHIILGEAHRTARPADYRETLPDFDRMGGASKIEVQGSAADAEVTGTRNEVRPSDSETEIVLGRTGIVPVGTGVEVRPCTKAGNREEVLGDGRGGGLVAQAIGGRQVDVDSVTGEMLAAGQSKVVTSAEAVIAMENVTTVEDALADGSPSAPPLPRCPDCGLPLSYGELMEDECQCPF